MIRSAIALTAIFTASALITPGGAWPQSDRKAPADARNRSGDSTRLGIGS